MWKGEETIVPLCHEDEEVVKMKSITILKKLAKLINESPQSCEKVWSLSTIPNIHNHHDEDDN